ncbi:glycosyltransferase [Lagierella sp.]|uniref:glycosyltransferase n=1 Tax=Lagierella sp. TaxID=2849657 RepID=UPI00260CA96D|nr:glycosyltransferase [Lagierella sp.]
MKYCFLLNFTPHPRIIKRIELVRKHYDTFAIYWDKGEDNFDFKNDIRKIRITVKADRNNPIKRIVPTFKFSNRAYEMLIKERPDFIHLQSFDMLLIAYKYKTRVNESCKIIYEVPDIHKYLTDDKKGFLETIISHYIKGKEEKMLKKVDVLILTSMKFWEHFAGKFDKNNMIFMPNIPNPSLFDNYEALREKNSNRKFTIGYIGGLRYLEELKCLVKAIEGMDIRLLMAGFEDGDYFKKLADKKDFIEYHGKFYYDEEIAKLYSNCDLIFSVYNADMKNVRIALPNKLYESILAKLPIIVAKNTYLQELVEEWKVGLAVEHRSVEEMREAVIRLMNDDNLYREIQKNDEIIWKELNPEKNNKRLLNLIKEKEII